jgi:hypothetical protein
MVGCENFGIRLERTTADMIRLDTHQSVEPITTG